MTELHYSEHEIRDWVAEIMICGFPGPTIDHHATQLVQKHRVRNYILFNRNVQSQQQTLALTQSMQKLADDAGVGAQLIVCKDQENGNGSRLSSDFPGLPCNMTLGAAGSEEFSRWVGQVAALQLKSVGVNLNLAPVLDVNNNAANPVIGVRSFSEDPHEVARLGVAMIQGLQSHGVIACAKHFPGHGDTATDSHHAMPAVGHAMERLNTVELVPFRAAIAAGVEVIMTAHVAFPAVDPTGRPATISKRVLTDFLRGELGYQGVITTDCLEMNAISEGIGVAEGAVQAVAAGADFIMVSHTLERQEAAIEALVEAVMSGRLPADRLQDAAMRVRRLRQRGLPDVAAVQRDVDAVHRASISVQERVCPESVTLVSNPRHLIPVAADKVKRVAVVVDSEEQHITADHGTRLSQIIYATIRDALPASCIVQLYVGSEEALQFAHNAEDCDLVVLTMKGLSNRASVDAMSQLAQSSLPVVLLATQSPYNLSATPPCTAIAVYESTPWMLKAGVQAIFTGIAGGRLPVTVSAALPRGLGA